MTTALRTGPFARTLAGALLWLGAIGAVFGVGYVVNGMTQAGGHVQVPVALLPVEPGASAAGLSVPGVRLESGWLLAPPLDGLTLGTIDGSVVLSAPDSTRLEHALARGDWLVGGLALLAVAVLLRPVLVQTSVGRPFAPGNARRLAVVALVVAGAGVLAPVLRAVGGILVLTRTGLVGGRLADAVALDPLPLLAGAVLLVLAAAFARGEQLARDSEGLV